MASANQQVHWSLPSPHVAFDGPLVHAHPGALRDPARFRSQAPAFGDKPAWRGNPIPIRRHRPGSAQDEMVADTPPITGDIATTLRVDEREIRALLIRQKPDRTSPTVTPVPHRVEPLAATPRLD